MHYDKSIATRIVELIQADGMAVGAHLPAQMLADRLRVSRTPVNAALSLLLRSRLVKALPDESLLPRG